ncbi:MAG: aconitase family protein [Desulfobacterales bacterium]
MKNIVLTGKLPDWVSAKDVILEMLRRHGVKGGVGKIVEYYGPGLKSLTAMDRHVIANMGAVLGATTTVFPSDAAVRKFLKLQEREDVWQELAADRDAAYDLHDEINLSGLEPMIAKPSSPGNVVPVSEVAGREIYQSYIGSSANPGFRDFAIAALIVAGRQVVDRVSLDINPTSRQILENLVHLGYLEKLIHAGARIHQPGCNGCIAKSFARIHWQNLINFGMLPLTFKTPGDWENIDQEDLLKIDDIRNIIQKGQTLTVVNETKKREYDVAHELSRRQVEMVLQGSLITVIRKKSG